MHIWGEDLKELSRCAMYFLAGSPMKCTRIFYEIKIENVTKEMNKWKDIEK